MIDALPRLTIHANRCPLITVLDHALKNSV